MDSLWLIFVVAFLLAGMAGVVGLALFIHNRQSGCDECFINIKHFQHRAVCVRAAECQDYQGCLSEEQGA